MRVMLFSLLCASLCMSDDILKLTSDCDLNKQDCTISNGITTAIISLTPRPIKPMIESTLVVSGLNSLKQPKIHLYGLSMFLGHLRDDLEKTKDNNLETQIMIAPCTDEKMLFRLEILDKKKIVGYIDFTMYQKNTF